MSRTTYASTVPSTVADIFAAAGTAADGVVPWGVPPAAPTTPTAPAPGIYVVALTGDVDSCDETLETPPISESAAAELLAVRPELTLDDARPSGSQLVQRLAAFWLPDEGVLYIGLAGPRKRKPAQGEVAKRVGEYYDTPLGANGPHAGGWPLKALSCLADLYVHYAYCDEVKGAEDDCIGHFAEHVSKRTRARLRDPMRVMPYANLEFPKGNAKNHGIRGACAPKTRGGRKSRPVRLATPAPSPAARARPRSAALPEVTARNRSQNVTAKDIEAGQVRVPIGPTKTILPPTRQEISVVLRGRELTCRWDPRYGEKERSGVIRVGKAAAAELLSPGDVLAMTVAADGSVDLG